MPENTAELLASASAVKLAFKGLKIAGFKSFADSVEIEICEGTSGVAGPNGCGKSNLIEALRWVMGEASFKNMRGGEMEDVIFSGTAVRPAHDMAEVALMIDNHARAAPDPWNTTDEIEVSRRIEREAGSVYRINGNEVRAEDVKLFFADIVGGAHSSALVSQGRIEEIVASPPQQRRKILEEAAGITGTQARRHKAELRLKAAEENMAQFDETMTQQRSRLRQVKKQARQANRYRALSGEILRLGVVELFVRHHTAQQEFDTATNRFSEMRRQKEDAGTMLKTRKTQEKETEKKLPALREAERNSAAAANRISNEAALWEKEIEGHQRHQQGLEETLKQAREDGEGLASLKQDAETRAAHLAEEIAELKTGEAEGRVAAELREASAEAKTVRAALEKATRAADERRTQMTMLTEAEKSARTALAVAEEEKKQCAKRLKGQEQFDLSAGANSVVAQKEAEAAAEKRRKAVENRNIAGNSLQTLKKNIGETEARLGEQAREIARLEGEISGLEAFAPWRTGEKSVLLNALKIEAGYELALAALLGDEILAPTRAGGAAWWQSKISPKEVPPLPKGAKPLSDYVKGAGFLEARLKMTGVMSAKAAEAAQGDLAAGQRLVSRTGELWRWDGWCASAAPAQAAQKRISKWQEMTALRKALKQAEGEHKSLTRDLEKLQTAQAKAEKAEREAAEALERAEQALEKAHRHAAELMQAEAKLAQAKAEVLAASEAMQRAESDSAKWQKEIDRLSGALAQWEKQSDIEEAASLAREKASAAEARFARAEAAISAGAGRLAQAEAAHKEASEQLAKLTEQMESLVARSKTAEADLTKLAKNSAIEENYQQKKEKFADLIAAAQMEASQCRNALAQAEQLYEGCVKKTRAQEAALADIRTSEARSEAEAEGAKRREQELREQVETEAARPFADVADWVELDDSLPLPELHEITAKRERLEQERLRLGDPNLQAGQEAEALEAECAEMEKEGEDLAQAVKRLHQGVRELDEEARQRLKASYEETGKNFAYLFRHLFGGGEASLELSGAEDILESGLEIIARPPGKKAQRITLLSGGEKTLTALALLFAAFVSRPMPVSVLDEVDAPLDERNVSRFCTLIEEAARILKTRFLVVTHNPITLARMDRLFGVTMQEKGVSQITGVELVEAENLREKAA